MKHPSTPITDQLLKQFKTMSQTKHTPAVTRVKYFLKNNRNNDAIEQIVYIPKLLIQVPDVKAYLKGLHPDPTGFGSIKYSFMVDTIIHYFERTIEDETAAERDRLKEIVKRIADLGICAEFNPHKINSIVQAANKMIKE